MIIIYKEFKGDKAEFTKKEIEELLEKARQDGYDEGYKDGSNNRVIFPLNPPLTTPTALISPTIPISPYWTCDAHH